MNDDETIVAWVGLDEFGSGRVGLKIGTVPAGRIPLAAMAYDTTKLEALHAQMQRQADQFNVTIRLARFVYAGDLLVCEPRPRG
jgi:hypothetical protein